MIGCRVRRLIGFVVLSAVGAACAPSDPGPPSPPTTIVVTIAADVLDNTDGETSLREAFGMASTDNADSTVVVSSGVEFLLTRCDLGGLEHTGPRALDVRADGSTRAIIRQTCSAGRVMTLGGSRSRLERLVLRGGRGVSPSPCGLTVYLQPLCQRGAGIDASSPIELVDVEMTDNRSVGSASFEGGALSARAGATITGSSLHDNSANRAGGAVASIGSLIITDSTLTSNTAGDGGALSVHNGSVVIERSELRSNGGGSGGAVVLVGATLRATDTVFRLNNSGGGPGGAIWADSGVASLVLERVAMVQNTGRTGALTAFAGISDFRIIDSTISDNTASWSFRDQYNRAAGGIATLGASNITIVGSTIAFNSAPVGGGANIDLPPANGTTVSIVDSIISDPIASPTNCEMNGNAVVVDGALLSDSSCGAPATAGPQLAALTSGAGTWFRVPNVAGPAVNVGAGPCSTSSDQRGVARPQAGACDIGAVEQ